MLDCREHCVALAEMLGAIAALETADAGGRHHASQMRIFSRAFDDAAPPGIARDIDHRRERPGNSVGSRFDRGLSSRRFHSRRIEARCLGDRDRIDSAESMNHVEPEEQRDLEPRFTRCDSLQLSRVVRPEDSEKRSDSAGSNQRLTSFGRARTIPGANAWQLIELSDFFLQSHQTKNRVGELRRWWWVCGPARGRPAPSSGSAPDRAKSAELTAGPV